LVVEQEKVEQHLSHVEFQVDQVVVDKIMKVEQVHQVKEIQVVEHQNLVLLPHVVNLDQVVAVELAEQEQW
jgi:hypothetical protein